MKLYKLFRGPVHLHKWLLRMLVVCATTALHITCRKGDGQGYAVDVVPRHLNINWSGDNHDNPLEYYDGVGEAANEAMRVLTQALAENSLGELLKEFDLKKHFTAAWENLKVSETYQLTTGVSLDGIFNSTIKAKNLLYAKNKAPESLGLIATSLSLDRGTKLPAKKKKELARISPLYKDDRVETFIQCIKNGEHQKVCKDVITALKNAIGSEKFQVYVPAGRNLSHLPEQPQNNGKIQMAPTGEMLAALAAIDLWLLYQFAQDVNKPLLQAVQNYESPNKEAALRSKVQDNRRTASVSVQEMKANNVITLDGFNRFQSKGNKQCSVVYLSTHYYEDCQQIQCDQSESVLVKAKIRPGCANAGKTIYIGTCHADGKGVNANGYVDELIDKAAADGGQKSWIIIAGDMNTGDSKKTSSANFMDTLKKARKHMTVVEGTPVDTYKERALQYQFDKMNQLVRDQSFQLVCSKSLIQSYNDNLRVMIFSDANYRIPNKHDIFDHYAMGFLCLYLVSNAA